MRIRIIIHGHVQGVFFRAGIESEANKLGLVGCVENLNDGTVEVVAEGPEDKLEKLVEYCQEGPPGASVSSVDSEVQEESGEFSSFEVRY